MYYFSSIFSIDGRSCSWRAACVFLACFPSRFRLKVGEVHGLLYVSWARSRDLRVRSGLLLGPLWAPSRADLGACGRSWVALGAFVGGLVLLWGPLWIVLVRSWSLWWRPSSFLGAWVGGLGLLFGVMLPVLGCSWGLCWGAWAVHGSCVGGLGHSWGFCWRSWVVTGRKEAPLWKEAQIQVGTP